MKRLLIAIVCVSLLAVAVGGVSAQSETQDESTDKTAEELAESYSQSDIVELLESDEVTEKEYRSVVIWSAENQYEAGEGDPDLDAWITTQAEQRNLSPEQILPQNEINTDRVLHEVGNGALEIHEVRTVGDTVEVDISTTRFQTITITRSSGDRLLTDTQTVGSGSRTIVVEDTSGIEDLYIGANREAVRVKHGSGLNLLPIIDSRLALGIGLVVVFSGLFVKAKKRRKDWQNRAKRVK